MILRSEASLFDEIGGQPIVVDSFVVFPQIHQADSLIESLFQLGKQRAHGSIFVVRHEVQARVNESVSECDCGEAIPIQVDPGKSLLGRQENALDPSSPKDSAHSVPAHTGFREP